MTDRIARQGQGCGGRPSRGRLSCHARGQVARGAPSGEAGGPAGVQADVLVGDTRQLRRGAVLDYPPQPEYQDPVGDRHCRRRRAMISAVRPMSTGRSADWTSRSDGMPGSARTGMAPAKTPQNFSPSIGWDVKPPFPSAIRPRVTPGSTLCPRRPSCGGRGGASMSVPHVAVSS